MNALIVEETNIFGMRKKVLWPSDESFRAGEEHFSAVDEHVENARSNFTCIHTHS